LTPGDAETLLAELGAMTPSRSALDRLPRELSARWEAKREAWEVALRAQETVPDAARCVALSVAGVMVAMKAKAAQRTAKQAEAGKHASGPAGHQEAGCGTVSLYDAEGERLQTVRYARMPERKKVTLQAQLQGEVEALVALRPDLRRVHLADGAEGNWKLLAEVERALGFAPETRLEIVDFYHVCDHLHNGCDAIWGESTPRSQAEFVRLKTLLKEEDGGAERVIRTFKHHAGRSTGHRQARIRAELNYFRNQRSRMNYPEYLRQHLPIASGVVEAACKTLVTQRLKCSSMAWSPVGGAGDLDLPQFDPERPLVAGLAVARRRFSPTRHSGEVDANEGDAHSPCARTDGPIENDAGSQQLSCTTAGRVGQPVEHPCSQFRRCTQETLSTNFSTYQSEAVITNQNDCKYSPRTHLELQPKGRTDA
jgi:hypothetical protein